VTKFEAHDGMARGGIPSTPLNVIHLHARQVTPMSGWKWRLHDYAPVRTMAFGIAGLSVVADSLAGDFATPAVKGWNGDESGLVVDYPLRRGLSEGSANNDNRGGIQLAARPRVHVS